MKTCVSETNVANNANVKAKSTFVRKETDLMQYLTKTEIKIWYFLKQSTKKTMQS